MLVLPITESWIISRSARKVYFCCAVFTIAFFGGWFATRLAMAMARAHQLTPAAATLVRTLLLPGVAGAATLWVAMWYFWFSFDHNHWAKKAFWFALLLFAAPLSTIFYYFLVYRRSQVFQVREQQLSAGA